MNWLRKIMTGRYGVDQLSNGMLVVSVILFVINMFIKNNIVSYIGTVIIFLSYIRIFSKDINKRYQENMKFLNWWNPIKYKVSSFRDRIKQSRTHKFFKCPSCGKSLRVPKGKGKINITCPSCKTVFEART